MTTPVAHNLVGKACQYDKEAIDDDLDRKFKGRGEIQAVVYDDSLNQFRALILDDIGGLLDIKAEYITQVMRT